MASRTKGSVPNVRKAVAKGDAARAQRKTTLNQARSGTEGGKLNDRVSSALRGPKRRNS